MLRDDTMGLLLELLVEDPIPVITSLFCSPLRKSGVVSARRSVEDVIEGGGYWFAVVVFDRGVVASRKRSHVVAFS